MCQSAAAVFLGYECVPAFLCVICCKALLVGGHVLLTASHPKILSRKTRPFNAFIRTSGMPQSVEYLSSAILAIATRLSLRCGREEQRNRQAEYHFMSCTSTSS